MLIARSILLCVIGLIASLLCHEVQAQTPTADSRGPFPPTILDFELESWSNEPRSNGLLIIKGEYVTAENESITVTVHQAPKSSSDLEPDRTPGPFWMYQHCWDVLVLEALEWLKAEEVANQQTYRRAGRQHIFQPVSRRTLLEVESFDITDETLEAFVVALNPSALAEATGTMNTSNNPGLAWQFLPLLPDSVGDMVPVNCTIRQASEGFRAEVEYADETVQTRAQMQALFLVEAAPERRIVPPPFFELLTGGIAEGINDGYIEWMSEGAYDVYTIAHEGQQAGVFATDYAHSFVSLISPPDSTPHVRQALASTMLDAFFALADEYRVTGEDPAREGVEQRHRADSSDLVSALEEAAEIPKCDSRECFQAAFSECRAAEYVKYGTYRRPFAVRYEILPSSIWAIEGLQPAPDACQMSLTYLRPPDGDPELGMAPLYFTTTLEGPFELVFTLTAFRGCGEEEANCTGPLLDLLP